MTYLARMPPPRRYQRRRAPALSGLLDPITFPGVPSGIQGCVGKANEATAPLDAKILDLVQTWQPTGFYTPGEIRQLIGSTMAMIVRAQGVLDQAASSPSASQDSIIRATDDLTNAGKRSLDYLFAANEADQQGLRTINAAGLKHWVVTAMGAASSAIGTAAAISCITPWWVGALSAFQSAFDAVWGTAKSIVGAVLAIGETALKVADKLPEFADVITWGLVAGAGYWVWSRFLSPRRYP